MLHERKSRGRKFCLLGRSPRGGLPPIINSWFLFHCLLFVFAVSASSCSKDKLPPTTSQHSVNDSITVIAKPSWKRDIARLDLFIYEDRGIRKLTFHSTGGLTQKVLNPEVDFIAVAIANSPGHIDDASVGSFDAMEALCMSYRNELAEFPLMSGMAQAKPCDTLLLTLTPLLCEVHLASVDNLLEGRPLLRNPRVYFRYANASAQVLRQDGFRASETVESPEGLRSPELFFAYLPEPVGYFRCEPGITLYCYPNDSPFPTIGTPRTELILEAEADSLVLGFCKELPALARASSTPVRVVADDNSLVYCKKAEK